MILGVDNLLKLVKEKKIVENLSKRELESPEGAGFDLRLGEVYRLKGKGFLGINERKTCQARLVKKFNPNKKSSLILKPNDFYLVKTIEKVNCPENLVGILKPRSTLQRMGVFLRTAFVGPGYSGELIFGLKNVGDQEVKIELGARIVQLMFIEVKGKTKLYQGQWQGGRVTTRKRERQI